MKEIPFARVCCDGNELAYVRQVLESGWLTTAAKAAELERRFAEAVGARYACAVNSCTAALHLAIEAVGIGRGDKVFVPTMTFTASAEVVRYLGADPVFLDVEYGSCLLTPRILEDAIARHPDVKCLIVVHYGGQAAEMLGDGRLGILDLCARHGIRIVEDAAHAFPSRRGGRMVGSFGDITCFSFYANKTITTGEGGMLVSNDEALVRRARVMRLHGIDRDVWNRFTTTGASWEYDVVAPGFKYNMPDIAAAVGLAQLERAWDMRKERERCARFYLRELAECSALDLPKLHVALEDHAWHLFPIVLRPEAPLSRNECIERLAKQGIGTSVHYKPLHRMTYYRETYGLRPEAFPNAEVIWRGCLSLPVYPTLSDGDLGYICDALKSLFTARTAA
jgi:dTDP-4-amino-4,6-dideoxygalactose transaminase